MTYLGVAPGEVEYDPGQDAGVAVHVFQGELHGGDDPEPDPPLGAVPRGDREQPGDVQVPWAEPPAGRGRALRPRVPRNRNPSNPAQAQDCQRNRQQVHCIRLYRWVPFDP